MKRILILLALILGTTSLMAQSTKRVLRVHNQGNIVFQMATSQIDSIKSHQSMATIYYGDGSWSRSLSNIDSMTFAKVYASDTTVILDTTTVDTSLMIHITWGTDCISVIYPFESEGVSISVIGGKVTVNAAAGISNLVYCLSGTSSNGSFVLNTDKKFILLLNGVNLTCTGNPAIQIKDGKKGVVHLMEGTINTFADNGSNGGKACFYSKGELIVQGGGTMYVTSSCVNGFQGKEGVAFLNGNTTISVSADAAKGIKSDGDIIMQAGALNITASGNIVVDTLADGTFDKSYSSGIKPDGQFIMNGGDVTINIPSSNNGGRCISTSSHCRIHGGYLTMTTAGNGSCLGGTGTNATDGYVNACIKSDSNIYLLGGHISAISTGVGGRGISADGHCFIGKENEPNDHLHLFVKTSGATTNPVGGGGPGGPGGWPGGNTSDNDYFKGIAKGIRIEGNIYIYSGHTQVYCAQTSGDPTGEAIESKDSIFIYGGDIEANAYDDAINATNYLEIRGGRIWAYSRGNDGIDCNANTNIYDGLLIIRGNEVGIDAATDAGGRFSIYGGTIITQGGSMGAWDTPNGTSTQRWISIQNANYGNNGILVINNQGDTLLRYKNNTVSGSGFIDYDNTSVSFDEGNGTKPPPGGGGSSRNGLVFSCPSITRGSSYTVYTSATLSGGDTWHGYNTNGTANGSGNATTVNAQ